MFIAKVSLNKRKSSDIYQMLFFWLDCYQDKLHPHERNRKQLEGKFSKQPGGGASGGEAAPAEE
jgi:hypothetical protein